ncbi:MAG TPA: glucosidase [Verrucomicrobiota bacterium]|nr:glucosidase [Verrucomicrobiota bacterium]
MNAEARRLREANSGIANWRAWGPYLSDRQWGTVREDYSADGSAWEYFPHDHARSRAYRWGEDGIAGVSDENCRLCLALALWNGKDPIIKERLFGLGNHEGNHGEDVKELYYHLDATPTHSYLKLLYKYPQRAFPYAELVRENARRKCDPQSPEFELLDTGIFDDDRYWDVFVVYAKAAPEDLLMQVTAHNRGPDVAVLYLLPQLWFRNTWSWGRSSSRPVLRLSPRGTLLARHPELGEFQLHREGQPELLFCANETNPRRHHGQPEVSGAFKDAFNAYLVQGDRAAAGAAQTGTKAGMLYPLSVAPGESATIRLRLVAAGSRSAPASRRNVFADFDRVLAQRQQEADAFYAELQRELPDADQRRVQRQAFAGLIWSKQFYSYDVRAWLAGDPGLPPPPARRQQGRNAEWTHLNNATVMSMPDKWEYPWYATWDLAFHCLPLALVDAEFAKQQLILITREWYMHPNGQFPAYEWEFGNVNPPVHAWAAWRVFQIDRKQRRRRHPADPGDLEFLERVYHKLLLNFTWWVNRKDAQGRNIFHGGFLGLDNISVFDRSAPLPNGGTINQADGTSWMAMYSLNLLRIALELAQHNRVYEDIATKFFEHFLAIAEAINATAAGSGLWDETDAFYYDELRTPEGREIPLKVRSMVGLIPLFAVETLEPELLARLPDFTARMEWYLQYRPDLARLVSRWQEPGLGRRNLLSLLRGHRMKCLLRRMLDETEFLSDYGIRALSKVHAQQPFRLDCGGMTHEITYWPGESRGTLFGGNSNWRGPVWMPVNYLLIESLQKFHHYYGDDFTVECPTGSGHCLTLEGVADEITRRLCRLLLRDARGQRAAMNSHPKLQHDPHFKDYLLFHEYFHGDTGRGLGASHQTGWTGLVAKLLQPRRSEASAAARAGAVPARKPRRRSLPAQG